MLIENISSVLKRICHAAMGAGRSPDEVGLVAVTKTVGTDMIQEAVDAGLRVFGENRVQEGMEKVRHFSNRQGISWHFIGTLQKNKVRKAVEHFDVIESVDSPDLIDRIDRIARELGKVQRIFIQVKLSEEETKHGAAPREVWGLVERAWKLDSVKPEGLMTIPPYFDDPEMSRPYFRRLHEMRDDLEEKGFHLHHLSMGMSGDFEVAIQEGATLVRVGTAIFGERDACHR